MSGLLSFSPTLLRASLLARLSRRVIALGRARLKRLGTAGVLAGLLTGMSAAALAAPPVITPALPSVHAAGTQKFQVTWNGSPATTGLWYVLGGLQNGAIDQDGTYHAPYSVPSPSVVTLQYIFDGGSAGVQTGTTQLTVTNPVPIIGTVTPSTLTEVTTPLYIQGTYFMPGTVVLINGQPMPTSYQSFNVLKATATLTPPFTGTVTLGIQNPGPGSSTTSVTLPAPLPTFRGASPGTLTPGWVSLSIGGTNFTPTTVATLDGRPMATTFKSATSLTARGYLPSWRNETSAVIGVEAQPGGTITGQRSQPVAAVALPYDTAARFATQAALGPRPVLVDHIQKIGLQAFLTEQFKQPGLAYSNPTIDPRFTLMTSATSTNSVLRLRVAQALNTFIPNQAIFLEYASFVPWERKLESDSFGNYRQLMTDIASDSRLGNFLNLAGNHALPDPNIHPNQNFSREFLQLFTLGTNLLNDDGSVQVDSSGNPLPTYGQDTILDFSRALTGWDLPTPVNPTFTAFQIDESRPLTAHDQYHDFGAKTLFGSVHLPAGQNTVTDRNTALDAIFNHANLPPFVSRLLITRLVTSNPSPAYISRVVAVFKDNGKGVRGDLPSVITAILLDPEARAGDTAGAANDGFLQDPLLFEEFLMNAIGQSALDSQSLYIPQQLGQDFWFPRSIFDYYPHSYTIPGTTINSPEWSLFNNLSLLHRSQYTYGFVAGQQPGVQGDAYMAGSWLFSAFSNLPDLIDALNHLLYHGQMSSAEQATILSYCSGITDHEQQFATAVFLAVNADSYNVSH